MISEIANIQFLHPSVFYILGGLLIPFLKGRVKQGYMLFVSLLAFFAVVNLPYGTFGAYEFLSWKLTFLEVDKLSKVFAYIFTIMGVIGVIYSIHVKNDGEHFSAFYYVGGSLGVIFAGDFLTLFLFWEMMAFSSVFLIWFSKSKSSLDSGFRYLLWHVAGGLILLAGIMLQYSVSGDLSVQYLPFHGWWPTDLQSLASFLIVIGFIVNAAVPPFGAWLPDAYPAATVTGAVFMSAFTTKTAVYALIRVCAGSEMLIVLGVVMAIYGVVYAVLENDARRLLAYHIISQVGYMVAGVGLGTPMAINGVVAHAFCHILYKSLLFMGTGSVLYVTGTAKLTELGGLYKTMPRTMIYTVIGGLSISAFPLFSGFVSKSMTVTAFGEAHLTWAFMALMLASAGTFLHTGLKVPYFIWFGKDQGLKAKEPPWNMELAMGIGALFCIGLGIFYKPLYALLPHAVHFEPYTAYHTWETLQVLLFTQLGFFLLLKKLWCEDTISLDTDWFPRKGAKAFMWITKPLAKIEYKFVGEIYEFIIQKPIMGTAKVFKIIDTVVVDGAMNGLGKLTLAWSRKIQNAQSGQIQHYAMYMVAGFIALIIVIMVLP
ncbi:MAG TPA: Na(+)/H(+) antiporter subunit D [Candidatus Marinimicrobia bacterium]|jgi:multicomponent Na+:H+ antiporter subunit D|nr:Na(+)/H(+) antiporter subunit D [Candidatus Neomarinimicrobiota bacterium]